jgi:hypothetical protein
MTTFNQSFLCVWCIHLHRDVYEIIPTCEAFPNGIPAQIIDSEADHRHTYPNDNGIQFVKTPAIEDEPPFEEMFGKGAVADNSDADTES